MAVKNTVGPLIKEARTKAKLTQEQLASKIDGLTASDVGKAERGEKMLTQDILKTEADREDNGGDTEIAARCGQGIRRGCSGGGDFRSFICRKDFREDLFIRKDFPVRKNNDGKDVVNRQNVIYGQDDRKGQHGAHKHREKAGRIIPRGRFR